MARADRLDRPALLGSPDRSFQEVLAKRIVRREHARPHGEDDEDRDHPAQQRAVVVMVDVWFFSVVIVMVAVGHGAHTRAQVQDGRADRTSQPERDRRQHEPR